MRTGPGMSERTGIVGAINGAQGGEVRHRMGGFQ